MGSRKVIWSVGLTVLLLGALLVVFLTSSEWFSGPILDKDDGASELSGNPGPLPEPALRPASGKPLATGEDDGAAEGDPSTARAEEDTASLGPVTLRGRVIDSKGDGVPAASVSLLDVQSWNQVLRGAESRFRNPLDAIETMQSEYGAIASSVPSVRTDDEGIYEFRGTRAGEYRLFVIHADFLPATDHEVALPVLATHDPPVESSDIELTPAAKVTGRIVAPSGEPIAGAKVRGIPSSTSRLRGMGKLIQTIVDLSSGSAIMAAAGTTSGPDGTFQLGSLEPIVYDIEAAKEGFARSVAPEVPAGTNDVVLVLAPGASVSGTVLSPDREPVARAEVIVRAPSVDFSKVRNPMMMAAVDFDLLGERTRTGTAADDGTFTIQGLGEGSFELVVRADGYPDFVDRIRLDGGTLAYGDVILPMSLEIAGVVIAPNGLPVTDATVTAETLEEGRAEQEAAAETPTDEHGRFVLGRLAPGTFWRVHAVSAQYGEASSEAGVEAGTQKVELHMVEGVTIRGIVRDEDSQVPIADAEIVLNGRRQTTRSDAAGAFEFQAPADSDHVFLEVRHADYPRSWKSFSGDDLKKSLEIDLSRGRGIEGRVVDVSGSPVEGAQVELEIPGMPKVFLTIENSGSTRTRTDEEGNFFLSLPRIGQGGPPIAVKASRPGVGLGYVDVSPAKGDETVVVELVLERPRSLVGHVTDLSGRAVSRARIRASRSVELSGEMAMMSMMMPPSGGTMGYSRDDGSFTISGLEPGDYDVEVVAIGYSKKTLKGVRIEDEETSLDVTLDPGATLRGRVIDPLGDPVPGADVVAIIELANPGFGAQGDGRREMERELAEAGATGLASDSTDPSGRFELTHLPDRALRVIARKTGYEIAVVADVRGDPSLPDIVLRPLAELTGRVIDAATRVPVVAFHVSLSGGPQGSRRYREPYQNPDGVFTIAHLPGASYEVTVHASGYAPAFRRVKLEPGASEEVTLELGAGIQVTGTAHDPSGTPVPGAGVSLRHRPGVDGAEGNPFSFDGRSDETGIFAIDGVPPGEYVIHTDHPNFWSEETRVMISELGPPELEVVLRPAGHIAGKLDIEGSSNERQVMLELRLTDTDRGREGARDGEEGSPPAEFVTHAWVGENGEYQGVGLRPGHYQVTVVVIDRTRPQPPERSESGEVEVVAGETREIDFDAR